MSRHEKTLQQMAINGLPMNEAQADSLFNLLKGRSQQRARRQLELIIGWGTGSGGVEPITDRLMSWMSERIYFRGDDAYYCAGQDYPSEITHIRNHMIGRV